MQLSFRDPHGQLLRSEDRVLRFVNAEGTKRLSSFLASGVAHRLTGTGHLVRTELVNDGLFYDLDLADSKLYDGLRSQYSAVVEHERIDFPNFPYEWSPGMLFEAAELTLKLAREISWEGFGLKDATPDNILFRGPKAVFVDMLSFEPRDERDPTWLPYAQFVRTFLLPLLVNKYFDLTPGQIFLSNRDGLTPEAVYGMCSLLQRVRPPFLTLVTIPTLLGGRGSATELYKPKKSPTPEHAQFILANLFRRLGRQLLAAKPSVTGSSAWTGYEKNNKVTSAGYVEFKKAFVNEVLSERGPKRVLDIGCNTGGFSEIAARNNADVVAIDTDAKVVDMVWRSANAKSLRILPLVVDIARPSPNVGWRNNENASFIERSKGSFDAVMMLAVIHHLLVTERIPLAEIISLACELTTSDLIIEFVAPDDEMFQQIVRGRAELHKDLTREFFEKTCSERFHIIKSRQTPRPSRWLYHLRKRLQN